VVELGIAECDRGLIGENGRDFELGLGGKLRLARLEHQNPEHSCFILERQVEPALDSVRLQIEAKYRDKHPLGV